MIHTNNRHNGMSHDVYSVALSRWIEMNALKEVSAPVAAIIYSAEPLWGAGLAYCILGDR